MLSRDRVAGPGDQLVDDPGRFEAEGVGVYRGTHDVPHSGIAWTERR
jgi:hypothetical protein